MKTILSIAVVLLFSSSAWAHAFIDHAEPAVGSRLASPPTVVRIWFTERLEPALSKIQVFDNQGSEVDKRDTKVDRTNRQLLGVSLPVIKAGKYRVSWRVVSVDTHVTNGSFEFEVAE
jgi:methionine-rich copper-binding protein CopC